jgi:DNA-directed RNA polymerase specialized sigma24 family protein
MHVLAGMLAKPSIFRYFGLPYSGRIAHLAEECIAAAKEGSLKSTAEWHEVATWLRQLPDNLRQLFALSCVLGFSQPKIAAILRVSPELVESECIDALNEIASISSRIISPV